MILRNWWRRNTDRNELSSRSRRPPVRTRLRVEVLETREVPAGHVAAVLLGGDLIVVGDAAANAVEILVTGGNITVQGRAGTGTTINGDSRVIFEGVDQVADDLRIHLRGGDDLIDIRGIRVNDNLLIRGDSLFSNFFGGGSGGGDQILLDQLMVGGDLHVTTAGGDDAVLLERSTVAGDTSISTGAGDDRFALVDADPGVRLAADTGSGDDLVFLDPTTVGGHIRIRTDAGNDDISFHGVNEFGGAVSLDGGRGLDRAEIDAASHFASGPTLRGLESVTRPAVTEFSAAEGLQIRRLPFGDPPGTGSMVFSLNGANFSGGEVTFTGRGEAYASAPTTYIAGPAGATITFDTPVERVSLFFVHFAEAETGTATAFDRAGNVVATAQSNQATFIGDPGNFVVLSGQPRIARLVINGGMIDNLTFIP